MPVSLSPLQSKLSFITYMQPQVKLNKCSLLSVTILMIFVCKTCKISPLSASVFICSICDSTLSLMVTGFLIKGELEVMSGCSFALNVTGGCMVGIKTAIIFMSCLYAL